MADEIYDIESLISDMTPEEIATVYPTASRRAPNFASYRVLINAKDVGSQFNVGLPKDKDPVDAARDLRYNLNEAAKERTIWKTATLTDDEQAQFTANKKIERFEREDGLVLTRTKDGWKTEIKEPVILRWKVDTKEVMQDVTKDGKTTQQAVKVPVRMYVTVVATDAVRHRAKRGKTEETPVTENAPAPEANGTAPNGAEATIGQQLASVG